MRVTAEKFTPEKLTEQAARWDEERAAALAQLEQVEAGVGASMLDDSDTAEALPARVAALRVRADMAGRAAAEARRRAQAARVAELRSQADGLDSDLGKAVRALEKHQAERDRLRKALEDFTGAPWQVVPDPGIHVTGPRAWSARPGEVLAGKVQDLRDRQARLRADADAIAEDPQWVPPEQRDAGRRRAEWAECVGRYRQDAGELADVRGQLEALVDLLGGQVPDVTQVSDVRALQGRASNLEQGLSAFSADVEFFRGLGLELDEVEVSSLLVEFAGGRRGEA